MPSETHDHLVTRAGLCELRDKRVPIVELVWSLASEISAVSDCAGPVVNGDLRVWAPGSRDVNDRTGYMAGDNPFGRDSLFAPLFQNRDRIELVWSRPIGAMHHSGR